MLILHDYRVRQRDFLLEITRAMTALLDVSEVLRQTLNASVVMLSGQMGLIALREQSGYFRIRATMGIENEQIVDLEAQLQALIEIAAERFESEKVEARLRRMASSLNPRLRQSVALPLSIAGKPVGVLIVFREHRGNPSPDDIQVLQSFADQAAIAVHNAQLYASIDEERRRLAGILDYSADGVMILDVDMTILRFNRALERMTGWKASEAIGLHQDDVIQWERLEEGDLMEAIANGWPQVVLGDDVDGALDDEAPLYVEGDLRRHDGLTLSVGITYAPLLGRGGKLANVIANVRDITNFRRAQEMQSTFISTVSHELRTPITLIRGYAETLSREDAMWDRGIVQNGLAVIEDEANRLSNLVDNLLTASKIQAQRMLELNTAPVHLDHLAERSVDRFRTQVSDHLIALDFPDGFPAVEADEARLRQVIDNLLSNALKYSPAQSTVEVGGHYSDDEVMLYVRDEGIGMTEAEQEHLFERFYRADSALSRKTEGTGLGLYLSRAIVEAHEGHIEVESAPGQGSTFYFKLPR